MSLTPFSIGHNKINYVFTEREDELIKNRTKCTEHNQILAHIREKMHHTDEVIDFAECDLGDAEMEFYRAREDLGMIKVIGSLDPYFKLTAEVHWEFAFCGAPNHPLEWIKMGLW